MIRALQRAVRVTPLPVDSAGVKVRGGILYGSLAEENPRLARQWDFESNGSHTPSTVSAGSNFRASWRCERGCVHCGLPHEWVVAVAQRSHKGTGCPFCSGINVCRCQSLAAKHPQLMKQGDWEGNQGTDPYSMGCSSTKKVLWTCTEHGQWAASPHKRVHNMTGCPKCARQRLSQPRVRRGFVKDEFLEIYAELHPTRNSGIDTETLTCGSNRKVWWLCQSDKSRPEGVNMSMHGRPLPTFAVASVFPDVCSAAGSVSVHAALLQHCTQLFCCTGTLRMPIRRESLWIHLSLAHTAIERFGGGMSWLMGGCITGVPMLKTWSKASEQWTVCLALTAPLRSAEESWLSAPLR